MKLKWKENSVGAFIATVNDNCYWELYTSSRDSVQTYATLMVSGYLNSIIRKDMFYSFEDARTYAQNVTDKLWPTIDESDDDLPMDEFNGYTIDTKHGEFTMAHRDDGIEIVCDGLLIYSSSCEGEKE